MKVWMTNENVEFNHSLISLEWHLQDILLRGKLWALMASELTETCNLILHIVESLHVFLKTSLTYFQICLFYLTCFKQTVSKCQALHIVIRKSLTHN